MTHSGAKNRLVATIDSTQLNSFFVYNLFAKEELAKEKRERPELTGSTRKEIAKKNDAS